VTATVPYERGLHEVADGVFAWLQPDGGWGWSNAGLVADGAGSLLVDTLFDLKLTQAMLDGMRAEVPAAAHIATVVNTHANGDHCFGNPLLAAEGAAIVASTASAAEMDEISAATLAGMVIAGDTLGPGGAFAQRIFSAFDFEGIEPTHATQTFDGSLRLEAGTPVDLIEVGPAHTRGDVIAHLPERGVVFTGDIVFNGGHPIVWADLPGWVRACDAVSALDPAVVVPGHGPLTDLSAVRFLQQYLLDVEGAARAGYDRGLSAVETARELHAAMPDGWRHLGESERLVVNVAAAYRSFGGDGDLGVLGLFEAMADLAG
jgi:glyoxylase-like metal-dependent hydrolase (beta-lactamase superfamily II)